LDWTPVRDQIRRHGMRNSNLMAIAPTATISDISGSSPGIEPIYKNIRVTAVGGGEITVVNPHLVKDLERLGLWTDDMLEQIRFCRNGPDLLSADDGNAGQVDRSEPVTHHLRHRRLGTGVERHLPDGLEIGAQDHLPVANACPHRGRGKDRRQIGTG
jgi:hypothetical protein